MCTAMLDTKRQGWSREDWETYNKKDSDFAERFKHAMLQLDLVEIENLVEEGKGYFHFPDLSTIQLSFSENIEFYLMITSLSNLFYKYDSIH